MINLGFEFIFQDTYKISQGLTNTIFAALAVGILLIFTIVPTIAKRYRAGARKARAEGSNGLPPEQRLIFAMIGAPLLPIGIFWMVSEPAQESNTPYWQMQAWTAYPSISIWSPIISNIPIGFGIIAIFISTYQYLIDAFTKEAASALVGITFVRYVIAGGMIPVSIPFYRNVGVHWTLTVLGALAVLMAPVPYVFYIYGAKIRTKSKFAA
jgi:hypothetical protein